MARAGIVAFAFGAPDTLRSNQRIANSALVKAKELNTQVYTQLDVVLDPRWGIKAIYTQEEPGKPPPTLRIARGAVSWALDNGIAMLWISAAKPHLKRCERDLRYSIREARAQIKVGICEGIWQYPENEWFCPESTQPRVRSLKEWRSRERLLEWMPMCIYSRVAS